MLSEPMPLFFCLVVDRWYAFLNTVLQALGRLVSKSGEEELTASSFAADVSLAFSTDSSAGATLLK
ncbi:MAG: hypothetical protein V7641_2883 [Blastocatellia bacterium]